MEKDDFFSRAARLLAAIRLETERVRQKTKRLEEQREASFFMSTLGHSSIIFPSTERK